MSPLWKGRIHRMLAIAWLVMIPVSLLTGLAELVVFVSVCSLYANAISHFGPSEAAYTDHNNPTSDDRDT